jgi:hypothetical protein
MHFLPLWFATPLYIHVNAMKAYMGSRGTAPLILNLSTRHGELPTLHPSCFTPGNESLYPQNRRTGGPPEPSEQFVDEKKLLALLGFKS